MAIDRDDGDERRARIERIMDEFREAERRSLLKRGIKSWNRTGRAQQDTSVARPGPRVDKFN
jgi:hypothetical protein